MHRQWKLPCFPCISMETFTNCHGSKYTSADLIGREWNLPWKRPWTLVETYIETYMEVPWMVWATPWEHVHRKSDIIWRAPGGRVYEQKTGADGTDSRIQTFFGWISDSIKCKRNPKILVKPWKLTSRLGLLAGQRYQSSSSTLGHLYLENAKYEAGSDLQEIWKFGSRCTDFTLVQNTPVFK